VELLNEAGNRKGDLASSGNWQVDLPAFGLAVVAVDYE
jgi:hypothetical protein